ncbi:MAG: MarR family transcriptional regulator [Colwellia sp.]|nr:MarR family transcriptional regulator [Colwellia sp.]
MVVPLLTEKYGTEMYGVLNCYDRVVISGNLQPLCYAQGMTGYLYAQNMLIFDYPTKFAEPLRDAIKENAEALAKEKGLKIEFIRKRKAFRKEKRIKKIIKERGDQPGLVHIFSAMEQCQAYRPWHDKNTGKTYVKMSSSKCLHYYFYFIDPDYGLCYLRVPTWSPFRLQFYFNGHNALAAQLKKAGIAFEQADNTFLHIADFDKANELSAELDTEALHHKLDQLAQQYCPVVQKLELQYHWSIMQAEYATDLVFKNKSTLQTFYPTLLETLIQAVKPADIAIFLGRKLHGNYQDEMGNRFNNRWLGSRIKHQMGPVSIKMYDKFNIVLRIETTVNNVSFFKQYRQVQHRDGTISSKYAPMKKTIYSLSPLTETIQAIHTRYLKFISDIDTPATGLDKLHQVTDTQYHNDRRYKGFNLLAEEDSSLLRLLLQGQFVITGFSNKDVRQHLPEKNSGQVTRLFKRLRVHGLIKRAGNCYRYYLSDFGRHVATTALKLREMVIIPQLASAPALK